MATAGGAVGPAGPAGTNGVGVPAGGYIHQALVKNSATDYDTFWRSVNYQLSPTYTQGDNFARWIRTDDLLAYASVNPDYSTLFTSAAGGSTPDASLIPGNAYNVWRSYYYLTGGQTGGGFITTYSRTNSWNALTPYIDVWYRVRFRLSDNFDFGSGVAWDDGWELWQGNGNGFEVAVRARDAIYLCISDNTSVRATNIGATSLIKPSGLWNGTQDAQCIVHMWETGAAGSGDFTIKVWISAADAPAPSPTATDATINGDAADTVETQEIFDDDQTPLPGSLTYADMFTWETEPGATDSGILNPYGVTSPN